MAKQKEQCPACGRVLGVPYLYHHMRREHGMYGGATGIKRNDPRYDRQPSTPLEIQEADMSKALVPVTVRPAKPSFKLLDEMVVLMDNDGAVWIAEKVRDA